MARLETGPTRVAHVMTTANTMLFLEKHISTLEAKGVEYHVLANFSDTRYDQGEVAQCHQVDLERKLLTVGDLRAFFQIRSRLKQIDPHVIIVSTPKAALIGSLVAKIFFSSRHRILLVRGYRFPTLTGLRRILVRAMEILPAFLSRKVLTTSQESSETMRRALPACLRKRVQTVVNGSANGIDTTHTFNPERADLAGRADTRARFGLRNDDIVLLFVGRVCVDKGIPELIEAFEICRQQRPDFKLLVAGRDDPSDPVPPEQLKRLDAVSVRAGFVSNEDMPDLYAAADLLIFPSRREGFGVAAAEAAAMGTPTIASRVGGLESAVAEGETGTFFPPGDAEALSDCIMRLTRDPEALADLGKSARRYSVNHFDQKLYDAFWLAQYRGQA